MSDALHRLAERELLAEPDSAAEVLRRQLRRGPVCSKLLARVAHDTSLEAALDLLELQLAQGGALPLNRARLVDGSRPEGRGLDRLAHGEPRPREGLVYESQ